MRARHKGGNPIDAYTRSGPCVNWTPEDGCKFSWEDRPAGGRGLIPQENKRCSKSTFDKVPGVISWIPFSDLLESVAESGLFEDTDCFTALADILG